MSEWQPIVTARKDGTKMLLYWPAENLISIGWFKYNHRTNLSYFSDTEEMDDYDLAEPENHPTHWMPLPDPPAK